MRIRRLPGRCCLLPGGPLPDPLVLHPQNTGNNTVLVMQWRERVDSPARGDVSGTMAKFDVFDKLA